MVPPAAKSARAAIECDEVHVWLIRRDRPATAMMENILDRFEKERAGRFIGSAEKKRFIDAHVAGRLILSRYLGLPPEDICYWHGPHGKPEIDGPNPDGIAFNLSHSGSMVLLAVASHRKIGVDVEKIRDGISFLNIARRYFSPQDYSRISTLSPNKLAAEFFRVWTRKEACLKASGQGWAPSRATITESSVLPVIDIVPAPGYAGALAVDGGRVKIVTMETTLAEIAPDTGKPLWPEISRRLAYHIDIRSSV